MADTPRPRTDLLALAADNSSGLISPQDLRDMLISMMGGFGCLHVVGGSTAQTGINGTPAVVTGFVANGAQSEQCTPDHTNDRITFDVAGIWQVGWTINASGSNGAVFHGQIDLVGTGTITGGSWRRTMDAAGAVGSAYAHAMVQADVGDYVRALISSDGTTDSLTPVDMSMFATRLG